ncbi:MAG TPA: hypothetical protein VGP32_02660 [Steroidobacteraceae bacterium]|nr:hypothetical protein [Steroidobacteraceae bacterium]
MTDPRQLALIHAEIDGELDNEQRAELARCLLADPDTRAVRDQLQRLSKALESFEEAEPPAGLRDSVLAALPQLLPRKRLSSAPGWRLLSAPGWRYAALIAGVAVAGVLVFETVRGPGPAATDVAGTVAAPDMPTVLDTASLANGPVSGHISLYRDHAGLGLELQVSASGPVDVRIAGEGHTQEVNGLGSPDRPGGAPIRVALPGFRNGETVELIFLMGGQQVGAATLRVPAGQ